MIDQQKNLKNTEFHLLQTTLAPFSAIQEKSLIDLDEVAENGESVVLVSIVIEIGISSANESFF